AALSACVAESSHGIGRDLAQGGLLGMILEYQHGMLLLHAVGHSALLAVVVADAAALGKARYVVRKALPDLERALWWPRAGRCSRRSCSAWRSMAAVRTRS